MEKSSLFCCLVWIMYSTAFLTIESSPSCTKNNFTGFLTKRSLSELRKFGNKLVRNNNHYLKLLSKLDAPIELIENNLYTLLINVPSLYKHLCDINEILFDGRVAKPRRTAMQKSVKKIITTLQKCRKQKHTSKTSCYRHFYFLIEHQEQIFRGLYMPSYALLMNVFTEYCLVNYLALHLLKLVNTKYHLSDIEELIHRKIIENELRFHHFVNISSAAALNWRVDEIKTLVEKVTISSDGMEHTTEMEPKYNSCNASKKRWYFNINSILPSKLHDTVKTLTQLKKHTRIKSTFYRSRVIDELANKTLCESTDDTSANSKHIEREVVDYKCRFVTSMKSIISEYWNATVKEVFSTLKKLYTLFD